MKTSICPACGCSLVRLGITKKMAVVREYQQKNYSFCCDGCADLFQENAQALLEETADLVVCPSCLAEKPINQTVPVDYKGETFSFCRCPHCVTVFNKDAEYYIKRLSGEIEFSGVFSGVLSGGSGCCN